MSEARPFASAEAAWRWAFGALQARQDGAGAPTGIGRSRRPCEPDDVVQVIERLHSARKITLEHARVLRRFAEAGTRPEGNTRDARLWHAALWQLDQPLRAKGIVA